MALPTSPPAGVPEEQSWSVRGAGPRSAPPLRGAVQPDQGWRPDDPGPPGPPGPWFDDNVVPVPTRPPGPPRPRAGKPPRRPQAVKQSKSTKQGKKTPPKARAAPAGRGATGARNAGRGGPATRRPANSWSKIAPVYDVDGPRIRYGVAWFVGAMLAVMISPITTAAVFAGAAGLAARQIARAWRAEPWQADLAAGVAAVPVLATAVGTGPGVGALVVAACVALGAGLQAPAAGLRGSTGRIAAAGVLVQATIPVALAGGAVVAVRGHSVLAAMVLFGLASAYEMGDFLVGSAASNPVEGPLAGGAAVIVVGFPLALLFVEPFDVMGAEMLAIAALCCPVGQWLASAVLPRPGADAPALRRIDTLLLLGPLWAVAAGAL